MLKIKTSCGLKKYKKLKNKKGFENQAKQEFCALSAKAETIKEAGSPVINQKDGKPLIDENGNPVFDEIIVYKINLKGSHSNKAKKVNTISENKTTLDAIKVMNTNGFRHLPVLSKKEVTGILSMRDLYAVANDQLQDSLKQHQEFLFGTGPYNLSSLYNEVQVADTSSFLWPHSSFLQLFFY